MLQTLHWNRACDGIDYAIKCLGTLQVPREQLENNNEADDLQKECLRALRLLTLKDR